MKYIRLKGSNICVCFILNCVISTALWAQAKPKLTDASPLSYAGNEEGSFKILFNGEVIGEEKFQILGHDSTFKALAEIHLTVERERGRVTFNVKPALQFTKFFEPLLYEVVQEASGNTMKARINFKPGLSEAVYEGGQGPDSREIELRKDVMVLDDNVFHHYIILTKRYDYLKGGLQEFSAFVPQQFLTGKISVSDKGFEPVKLGDKTLSLQHLVVDTGEIQVSLWLSEPHELRKISVPKSNIDVLRE